MYQSARTYLQRDIQQAQRSCTARSASFPDARDTHDAGQLSCRSNAPTTDATAPRFHAMAMSDFAVRSITALTRQRPSRRKSRKGAKTSGFSSRILRSGRAADNHEMSPCSKMPCYFRARARAQNAIWQEDNETTYFLLLLLLRFPTPGTTTPSTSVENHLAGRSTITFHFQLYRRPP